MDKQQKIEMEHRLLQRVRDEFSENAEFPSVIEKYTVAEQEVEICRVMHKDPESNLTEEISEFYFLETVLSAPDVVYFTGMITLTEDIPPERLYDVMVAVTRMNANMPFGSYILNTDVPRLGFRLDGVISAEGGEDAVFEQVSTIAAHTIEMSGRFSRFLMDVCDGSLTPEELRETLGI